MSGYRSSRYRGEGGEQPSLDWLFDGTFPRGIWPTDVDWMVEINSHLLIGEVKSANSSFPDGQRLALRRMSAPSSVTTLMMRPEGEDWMLRVWGAGRLVRAERQTPAQLRAFVEAWGCAADQQPLRAVER